MNCGKICRLPLVLLGCVFLVGCHESGNWKDDAKNWKRIFHTPKPADVKITHSSFWRSPHFTYEFEYFLQIERNDAFKKTLVENNKLKQLTTETELRKAATFFGEKPAWFLPKAISSYDVWTYADESMTHFIIFIDRQTGDLFLTDFQV
jgi:hypothetical protein